MSFSSPARKSLTHTRIDFDALLSQRRVQGRTEGLTTRGFPVISTSCSMTGTPAGSGSRSRRRSQALREYPRQSCCACGTILPHRACRPCSRVPRSGSTPVGATYGCRNRVGERCIVRHASPASSRHTPTLRDAHAIVLGSPVEKGWSADALLPDQIVIGSPASPCFRISTI